MQTEELLQKLGLSEKETRVYLALLSMGSASAYALAVKSGLKRPTTYLVLDELRKKGLVKKVPRAKKTLFIAESPEEFLRNSERWLMEAKRKLPELMALAASKTPEVKVLHFEGARGIQDMMRFGRERMRGKAYIGFYAQPKRYDKEMLDLVEKEMEIDAEKYGITYRGMAPEHPVVARYATSENPKYNIKTVPPEYYDSDTSLEAGEGFLRLVDIPNAQGVIIENPNFARTLRQVFEMLWHSMPQGGAQAEGGKEA